MSEKRSEAAITKTDSATTRLLGILIAAKQQGRQQAIRQTWAAILGYPADDTARLLNGLADLIRLTSEAKIEVQELPEVDHTIYLQPFEKLERAFAQGNLDASWDNFVTHLDEATMVALQFCADTVRRQSPLKTIPSDELKKVHDEVAALLEIVLRSELPTDLQLFLVDQLQGLLAAINGYRVTGSAGLERALQTAIGAIYLNQQVLQVGHETESSKPLMRKFASALAMVAKLVAFAKDVKELMAPAVIKLLGPGAE